MELLDRKPGNVDLLPFNVTKNSVHTPSILRHKTFNEARAEFRAAGVNFDGYVTTLGIIAVEPSDIHFGRRVDPVLKNAAILFRLETRFWNSPQFGDIVAEDRRVL